MFCLTIRDHIMIAHSLPHPSFGPAQALHGATLVAEVTWYRQELNEAGVVLDIGEASQILDTVLNDLRYRNLDDHPAFAATFSTTEAIAAHIANAVRTAMPMEEFSRLDVLLRENPDAWARYRIDL